LFSIFPFTQKKFFEDFSGQTYCPSLKKIASQAHQSARVFCLFSPLAEV